MGIGQRIREYRKMKGLKLNELSKITGIAQGALSDIENEKNKPSMDTLLSLIEKTDVNPEWLLTGKGTLLRKRKSKEYTPEEEKFFREDYSAFVFVLENFRSPWRCIPRGVIEYWKETKEGKSIFIITKTLAKLVKTAYATIEFILQGAFFYINPYWDQIAKAIWEFYWALQDRKKPTPATVAVIGILYTGKTNFVEAALLLQEEMRKIGFIWNYDEKIVKESLKKEKITFQPQKETLEPQTFRFLRQAAKQLVLLTITNNLPEFCLAHSKVYWYKCPICIKLEK